jgi:hypothetical protein
MLTSTFVNFLKQDNRSAGSGKVINYKLDLSATSNNYIHRLNSNAVIPSSPLASPVAVRNLPGHKLTTTQIKSTINKKLAFFF